MMMEETGEKNLKDKLKKKTGKPSSPNNGRSPR
jgi:hypothetical protein